LEVSVQNFTQLGGRADFLCPLICICVSGLMRFHNESDIEYASDFVQPWKQFNRDPGSVRQAFEKESMSLTWMFEWKILN
jgi:hypothetical protein